MYLVYRVIPAFKTIPALMPRRPDLSSPSPEGPQKDISVVIHIGETMG